MSSAFLNESTFKGFAESGKEATFDLLFDDACRKVKAKFGSVHPAYISGTATNSGERFVERSPIDAKITIGEFQRCGRPEAKNAIAAARRAFEGWSSTDYRARIAIFRKAAKLFSAGKFELAAILSYENGKSRYESIGEVDEAIDFLNYYSNEMELNKGFSRRTELKASSAEVSAGFQGSPETGEKVRISLRPYGVFGVLAPFNFPLSISVGMSSAALLTGNTVVFKPSSDNMTMLTGLRIYETFVAAGLPAGVFNYLTGPGSEVGDELVKNQDVAGIAFTGSRKVGLSMMAKVASLDMHKNFIVEMGGKNPAIVTQQADLDCAVSGISSAAFGFSGQKCSSLSRVYVHNSIKELFLSKLIERTRSFRIGNPLDKDVYLGPLISAQAYKNYEGVVQTIGNAGKLVYGGKKVNAGLDGFYVEPVIAEMDHENELYRTELFLPVLLIDGFQTLSEAIRKANASSYGLTAGLYSRKSSEQKLFQQQIEAGTVYINRCASATTGAMVGVHSFVGWKDSGVTGKGTGSRQYLQQFMREQSVSTTK